MKKYYLIIFIFIAITSVYGLEPIHDDYVETNKSVFHSYGLLSYGAHTNTFHLRFFYLRYNFNFKNLQVFATLNGYKDTHIPETNYNFILNNINLYDYGVQYLFFGHLFLSLRGAAVYRKTMETYLLIPHFTHSLNPAEFDSPPQYLPIFLNAVGIRIGYISERFEVGYSQGDWRHSIPMGLNIKYKHKDFFIRTLIQLENSDPLIFALDLYRVFGQASFVSRFKLQHFDILGIAEISYDANGEWWIRIEEGIEYKTFMFAMRQIVNISSQNNPFLFEVSIKKNFFDITSFGIFAATDGRIYIGSEIKF